MSLTECYQSCRETSDCQGVTVRTAATDDAPTDCWRRREIDTTRCPLNDAFDLLYNPNFYSPSAELLAYLNGSYSEAVYGVTGALDANFRVIWPSMLSDLALALVRTRCTMPADSREDQVAFAYPWPGNRFLQHAALWLYRPRRQLTFAVENDTWVEVTHCAYTNGVADTTPMYFFLVPGSGLHLNVGRSLHLRQMQDGDDDPHFQVHRAIDRGDLSYASGLLGIDLSSYDSIQYPLYSTESWRGAMFTEIAMLKWHNERDHVTARLSELRCGPAGALRACRRNEPAVSQMTDGCLGEVPTSIQTLRQRSQCEDVDPVNGEHVDIWGEDLR